MKRYKLLLEEIHQNEAYAQQVASGFLFITVLGFFLLALSMYIDFVRTKRNIKK
jgi:hypothetical protein